MTATITPTVTADNAAMIRNAYEVADKAEKAKIRAAVNTALMDAVRNLDMVGAKAAQDLIESLKTVKTQAPVDVNLVLATRIATLRLASVFLQNSADVPSGIEADSINYDLVNELVEKFMESDELNEAATQLAQAKITRKSATGDRRDIGAWIERAAESMTVGQFATITQIINLGIDQDSDDTYRPSSGAVAARLYPTKGECTLDLTAMGIELAVNSAGTKGIRKL